MDTWRFMLSVAAVALLMVNINGVSAGLGKTNALD